MEFWAALVGAVVGGGATFAASAWQTRRILRHERQMATDAREAEAVDRRRERAIDATTEMIDAVGKFVTWRPQDIGGLMPASHWAAFDSDTAAMRVLDGSRAPMVDKVCRQRWATLLELVQELRSLHVSEFDDPSDTHAVTREIKNQAAHDVMRFARYTLDTLVSSLDGADLPREIAPPILRRELGPPWNWDPERQNRDW